MRIRTILAAAAAPAALAAALLGTTAAHAATLPNGNSATAVHNQSDLDALVNNGVISGNIDVAADAHVTLAWTTVNGNVSVEGVLAAQADTFNGNVTVSGPGSELSLYNDPGNHITGNLTVTGSSGQYDGGPNTSLGIYSNGQQVDGGLTFTGNTGRLATSGTLHVNGKVTYHPSGRDDLSQLTWGGKFVTV
jgi:hypothetical protein